ncbi:hypothetical protein [Aquimarina aggregata]|uniref:hypothetical protein n=1 Tax=Aquimarina aggregata TaxID=1642818 RepID=UPI00248FD4F1|nr:hypothetical protein [Aquimarina aggregata]
MKQFACTTIPKTTPTKTTMAEKTVTVLDEKGQPLPGVHVIGTKNTITDAKGQVLISTDGVTPITFTHVGKVTEKIPFNQLPTTLVLMDVVESLGDVIINVAKKESNLWIWMSAVGYSAVLIANAQEKPKKTAPKKKTPEAPTKVNL